MLFALERLLCELTRGYVLRDVLPASSEPVICIGDVFLESLKCSAQLSQLAVSSRRKMLRRRMFERAAQWAWLAVAQLWSKRCDRMTPMGILQSLECLLTQVVQCRASLSCG